MGPSTEPKTTTEAVPPELSMSGTPVTTRCGNRQLQPSPLNPPASVTDESRNGTEAVQTPSATCRERSATVRVHGESERVTRSRGKAIRHGRHRA